MPEFKWRLSPESRYADGGRAAHSALRISNSALATDSFPEFILDGRLGQMAFEFRTMKCRKLKNEEWKFENLSNGYAREVFLYEYLRYSTKFRNLILRLREMDNPCMLGNWPNGYMPMTVMRREFLRKEVDGGETFERLVEALMNCPKFPKTSSKRQSRLTGNLRMW